MSEVKILPMWKNAVKNIIAMNPQPGFIISNDMLWTEFGIAKPTTVDEFTSKQLEFLTNFQEFRDELLEAYKVDLRSIPGKGYEILAPKDQTRHAMKFRTRRIKKQLSRLVRSVANVDTSKLSESERKENTDALARTAQMTAMFSRRNLLGRN